MTSKSVTVPGINIQYPISRLLLSGEKTIETRTYPIPSHLIGKSLAVIETPGSSGKFKARVVGLIVFGESFKYSDEEEFYRDSSRHKVDRLSPWKWDNSKPKWGWPVLKVLTFTNEAEPPQKRGIKYTRNVRVKGSLITELS